MVEALQGHLSLIHAYYGNDGDIVQTGETVSAWRQRLKQKLKQHSKKLNEEPNEKSDFNIEANKYSGYVYDAVWLYALALDKLVKQDQSYIQDIHSNRSVNA